MVRLRTAYLPSSSLSSRKPTVTLVVDVGGQVAHCVPTSVHCYLCNWNATEHGASLVSEAGTCRFLLLHLVLLELVSIFIHLI